MATYILSLLASDGASHWPKELSLTEVLTLIEAQVDSYDVTSAPVTEIKSFAPYLRTLEQADTPLQCTYYAIFEIANFCKVQGKEETYF